MGLSAQPGEETISVPDVPRTSGPRCVARLVVVYPRDLAGVHPLAADEVTIGRARAVPGSLVLAHATVSRSHAAIRWDAAVGSHVLVDLRSHNGTWCEGGPLGAAPRFLIDQAVLRFGSVLAVYERQELPNADAPEVDIDAVPGASFAACSLRAAIARAARDTSPALILGETGAGKERVAAELHRLSGRRGLLVTVNCAALSSQLIESQLFGHTRGAFTGATHEHAGLFRAAKGGTLFLDEIGELPVELQPKLLRAVELGEVVAVGSTQPHHVDVRLIAATNRALATEVEQGRFRRDLYARLALWELHVPPLLARRADLIAWIDRIHHVWCAARQDADARPLEFEAAAVEALLLQRWPDNLRGLQRLVHELGAAANGAPRTVGELGAWGQGPRTPEREPTPTPAPVEAPGAETQARRLRPRPAREELLATLTAYGWSIRATARHYQRERKQISRWLEMYAIAVPSHEA